MIRIGFKASSGTAWRRPGEKCWAASAPESGRRWEASRSQDTCLPTGESGTVTPGAAKAAPTAVAKRTNPTSPIRTLRTSVLLRRLAWGKANTLRARARGSATEEMAEPQPVLPDGLPIQAQACATALPNAFVAALIRSSSTMASWARARCSSLSRSNSPSSGYWSRTAIKARQSAPLA